MKAERLLPQIPELPQCEAKRQNRYANDRRDGRPYQCEHRGRYRVAGRALCSKHAGQAALRILLGEPLPEEFPK